MIERILGFAALVVRALQIKVEESSNAEQARKLRNWREAGSVEVAPAVCKIEKAYRVTGSGH